MKLEGKVAVITGGSQGMGAAAGHLFSQEGARVVLVSRGEKKGQKVVTEIRAKGGEAHFVKADVSKVEDVKWLMDEALSIYKGLHILYNNAAVFLPEEDSRITEVKEETWEQVVSTNLTSVFLCCKYAIPVMIQSGGGSIISTSSTGGILGLGNTAYGATKAGVINLMQNVAMQFAEQKIRANTIVPGIVETPMSANLFADPEVRRRWESATPVGRFGKSDEIAHLALYLASDDSAYVTGATFVIDGGFSAR
jgi:NAD(P)-dependent dehydrogenase (short-subunit alcohol dehydrogenase family)